MQMNLFTIKRAIAIYLLKISRVSCFFLLFSLSPSFATEDLNSFCFESKVNLKEVESSIQVLLLSQDKLFLRPKDHCIDIVTAPNRANLLEKFLRKRYNITEERSLGKKSDTPKAKEEYCRIELTTSKEKSFNQNQVQVSRQSEIFSQGQKSTASSVLEILLRTGVPGNMYIEGQYLQVECHKIRPSLFKLVFSYGEAFKSRVSTELDLSIGEKVNFASVLKNLNDEQKKLGLPETFYRQQIGEEKITYEIKITN